MRSATSAGLTRSGVVDAVPTPVGVVSLSHWNLRLLVVWLKSRVYS